MNVSIRIDGVVSFWSLGVWTSRQTIEDGWKLCGTRWEKFVPQPRTPQACLHDALAVVFPKALIRPLERRDGFAILHEQRYHDEVVTRTTHAVAVDDQGNIDIRRGNGTFDAFQLEEEFRRQSGLLRPSQVTASMVAAALHLGATTLRPSGGVYWLPEKVIPEWDQLCGVVQLAAVAGKNTVYKITHTFDADSILAVRDALLAEVEREANAITAEVDGGGLGERALKTRASQAERLRVKIEEYERILGERLPDAKEMARRAEMTATAAKILATGAA